MNKRRNGDVIAISVGLLVFFMFTWNYLLPSFLMSLGGNDRLVGVSFSLNFAAYTVFQFIGGTISDRIGRKPLIVFPGYITAVSYMLSALCRNVYVVVALLAIAAIMSALQWPAMLAMIADIGEGTGTHFARMEAFVSLGIALGPFAGAILLPMVGVRGLLIIYAAANFFVSLARHYALDENFTKERPHIPLWSNPFVDRTHLILALAAILTMVAFNFSIYGPFIQMIEKEIGYSDARINLSFFYGNLIGAALGFAVGDLIERKQLLFSWATGLFMMEAILLIWSTKPSILLLVIALPFSQLVHIAYNIGLSRIGDADSKGRVFGAVNTLSGLLSAPAPVIGINLSHAYGKSAPFVVATVLAIANASVILALKSDSAATARLC